MFSCGARIINAAMARALHANACQNRSLVGWVVWHGHPAHPSRFIAQLATENPLPNVLIPKRRKRLATE
jgi:hypothetical protein